MANALPSSVDCEPTSCDMLYLRLQCALPQWLPVNDLHHLFRPSLLCSFNNVPIQLFRDLHHQTTNSKTQNQQMPIC
jgi:hypothetical protein